MKFEYYLGNCWLIVHKSMGSRLGLLGKHEKEWREMYIGFEVE